MRVGPSEPACRSRFQTTFGAGSKPPSAALSKRQGRERGRKRPGITGSGDRQEEDRKGTTVEVSKRNLDDVQNRGRVTTAGSAPTIPAYGRSGVRHERWPELAMRRLNGTGDPELGVKRRSHKWQNHEGERTNAEFRFGLPHSSDEAG